MKLVFVSNFYNHHQSYLSKKLYEITNGQYRFIETTGIPEERTKLGYASEKDEFVLNYEESEQESQKWIDEADIVIIGSSQKNVLYNRKRKNKIIIRYSERPLKKGFEIWKYSIRWLRWHISNPNSKPIYLLCASGYAASDYAKFGMFKGKSYKWGYFPKCTKYENIDLLMTNKKNNEILWCGRFLDWKRPNDVLEIAKMLKKDGYDFHISMIGTGEMEADLRENILKNDLKEKVSLLGAMTPEQVRQNMENAGIYLFTSDRNEGWGAVLNESMNSGCAVIASKEIGSVPYLLKDNENGLIYNSGDIKELYKKIKYLLENKAEQERLGKVAYRTITEEWNYEIAAERLLQICENLLSGKSNIDIFECGPCSKA